MLEEIKRKIINNNDCDLSIEELKILYEIDTTLYSDISEYREKRNNYEDFCKMFGSLHVARSPQEINIDTIAYIGNLYVEEELPTYNLRYIYGNLIYYSKQIKNLENLEIVYNDKFDWTIKFDSIEKYEGLDNLRIVPRFYFDYLYGDVDMSSIEYVETLSVDNLHDVFNIRWPQKIDNVHLENLISISSTFKFPNNLEGLYLLDLKEIYDLKFPDNIKILNLMNLEKFDNLKLPCNLKTLYIPSLDAIKGLTIYDDLNVYANYKLVHSEYLNIYCNVIKRDKKRVLNKYSIY